MMVEEDGGGDPQDKRMGDGSVLTYALVRKLVEACHARMGRPLPKDDLDDVVQDAHVAAWRRRMTFRGDSTLETWLYGIARLTLLKHLTRARRRRDLEPPLTHETPIPEVGGPSPGSLADTGISRMIRASLEADGSTSVLIFRAHNLEGQSFREIALGLGRTESAVKARYYRAIPALRKRLARLWHDYKK